MEHSLYSLMYYEKKQKEVLRIEEAEILETNRFICDARVLNKEGTTFKEVKALIDTGATFSALNPSLIKPLMLQPYGYFTFSTPDYQKVNKSKYDFLIQINGITTYIAVTGSEMPYECKDFDIIIGMDVIRMGKLVIDKGNLTFDI